MAGEQFKFPDEIEDVKVEVVGDDDFEVEVVDDTPEQDRGRKPLDREVEDPTDDEIEQYTQGAQKRIKELTHARHDERRAKEATLREKQELEVLTQRLLDENKKLRQNVNTGSEQYTQMAKTAAEAELDKARREYKAAKEAFDYDSILEAQEELIEESMKYQKEKKFQQESHQGYVDDDETSFIIPILRTSLRASTAVRNSRAAAATRASLGSTPHIDW